MVEVNFSKGAKGFSKLSVVGHATTSDACSYVSGISWTIAGAVTNMVPASMVLKLKCTDGNIEIEIVPNEKYNILFEVAYIGYKQLEKSNPQDIVVKTLE